MNRALNSMLLKTIVAAFYKRHALFFGIVLFFFVMVVRPPSFFFSEIFVGYLLQDWFSVLLLFGVFLLYFAYTLRFLLTLPSETQFQFLHLLPAYGRAGLRMGTLLTSAAVLGPALLYLLTMFVHGLRLFQLSGWLAGVLGLVLLLATQRLLTDRLMRPLAPGTSRFQLNWRLPKLSMPRIYLGMLRRRHRNAFIVTKLASVTLLLLLVIAASSGEVPYALRGMTFLGSALLQSFLVYRLRETEKQELSWFRNLPFSRWRRIWHFLATHLLLNLPEFFFLLLFTLRQGLSGWLLPHFAFATTVTWLLAAGLTYLPQMRSQDFFVLLYSFAVGVFIALLFKISVLWLYGPIGMLAIGILAWGVYRED